MVDASAFPAVLHYFDGRGRANPIRFLLEETGTPYREECIRDANKMAELRESGKLMYGQVPMLEIDGVCIVQVTYSRTTFPVLCKKLIELFVDRRNSQALGQVDFVFQCAAGVSTFIKKSNFV
jgi:hypothetical protein